MEIKSPPAFRDEPVTQFDIGFIGVPDVKQITLHEGDTKTEHADCYIVTTQKPAETVTLYKHAIAWTREAETVIRWPIDVKDVIKGEP